MSNEVTQRAIQMVDLRSQYASIKFELEAAFAEIFDSADFISGNHVRLFARDLGDYLGVEHVTPCANGTDALQIALMALDLKPGDEVIVPAFTFIASIEVIALMHLVPVVVDVDCETFNLKVSELEEAISRETKAIIPVHLFGQCADMDEIMSVAQEHQLYVIEDNAQSIGSIYAHEDGRQNAAGSIGDIGTLSFYPSKNLGAYGDAGALITRKDKFGEIVKSIANHGMSRQRYYHDRIGVNSRMDSFQAAVLWVKLKRLATYIAMRQRAADYYDARLGNIEAISTPVRDPKSTHVFHQYTMRVARRDRDQLRDHLANHGIPSMIYYPVPIQDQPAYSELIRTSGSLENSTQLTSQVLSLPMHSELKLDQLDYICDVITAYFN